MTGDAPTPASPANQAGSTFTSTAITQRLIAFVSNEFGLDPQEIDIRQPFASYGLTSIGVMSLLRDLEEWLGTSLSPSLAWDYPTIETLGHYLASLVAPQPPAAAAQADAAPRDAQAPAAPNEPIAIVGMACRFPGAKDLKEFWELLYNGVDAIREVPADRWNADAFYDPTPGAPGKMVTRWGGFLDSLDQFDAAFFGISPREAAHLDPRQRMLAELAWEALEDAGIPPDSLAGSNTGVFIAALKDEYSERIFAHPELVDAYTGTGNADTVLANRISYILDLRGPSLSVDTACSGSLVAIHLACQSLHSGESSLALVGGANLILNPDANLFFSRAGALAPDGRCKTFDARANGIVRSEGAGLLVLKRLTQAQADGDPIYAIIRGSAVNQDGRTNGLMAPNSKAQEAVLRQAYRNAGIEPAQVQYVEAHGTGTRLGDPIEVQSLGAVLGAGRPADAPCMLGSVKTNLGHLEAAAGVAGVIKVALAMKHHVLPPSLHFQSPNPLIPFDTLPFKVQQSLGSWPREDAPLIAGVSGFGFGGTNAHVVLQEPPAPAPGSPASAADAAAATYLLPLSARTPAALRSLARAYHWLATRDGVPLADICYTASVRRAHLEHRLALVASEPPASERENLALQLAAFLSDDSRPELITGSKPPDSQPRLVWVLPGEAARPAGRLSGELLSSEPVFRASIEETSRLLQPHAGWSLLEALERGDESRLNDPEVAQPAVFAFQVALAALWRSWGIAPDLIVGQGLGEIAAAHIAGALSQADAVRIAFHRGRLAGRLSGAMATIGLPLDQAQLAITAFEDVLAVAGSLGPATSVISGDPAALDRVLKSLERRGVACAPHAAGAAALYGPHVDGLRAEFVGALGHLHPQPTAIPLFSTVTNAVINGMDLGAEYWARNWREPFQLGAAIDRLIGDGYATFLELSPQPLLESSIADALSQHGGGAALPSLPASGSPRATLLSTLGALYAAGHSVDWARLYPNGGRLVTLPTYPWQRERYWFDMPARGQDGSALSLVRQGPTAELPGVYYQSSNAAGQHFWIAELSSNTMPDLIDGYNDELLLLPGGLYLEMILAAAHQIMGAEAYALEDVVFHQPLSLDQQAAQMVQLILRLRNQQEAAFQVFSLPLHARESTAWRLQASGAVGRYQPSAAPALSLSEIKGRTVNDGNGHAPRVPSGLIDQIWQHDNEIVGHVRLPQVLAGNAPAPRLQPGALHASFEVARSGLADTAPTPAVPAGLARVQTFAPLGQEAWCHVAWQPGAPDQRTANISLFNDAGQIALVIEGLRFA